MVAGSTLAKRLAATGACAARPAVAHGLRGADYRAVPHGGGGVLARLLALPGAALKGGVKQLVQKP